MSVFLVTAHTDNEKYLSEVLKRLADSALSKDQEPDIGVAFEKFSVVTRDLSTLLRTLVSTLVIDSVAVRTTLTSFFFLFFCFFYIFF